MTDEIFRSCLGFGVGLCVGTLYFIGLWKTVRALPNRTNPHWFVLASFLARAALVLGVFVLVAREGALAMIACMVGFLVARVLMVRRFRPGFVR